jgi:hypothetical protein
VPNDRTMSPELLEQLTLAILDQPAEEGLQVIKLLRCSLETWETFLQDRQQLQDHLMTTHKAGPACAQADSATLNRQHWEAHGGDLTSFLGAHPASL